MVSLKNLVVSTATAALLTLAPAVAEMNSPTAARHVLSLNDVEITALIDDVSIITGNTFVLHPDVRRTKVTVMSQTPMTTDEVFQVFLSTLRVHGFAAIPAGRGVYRVVPEQSAVGEALTTSNGANGFMTEILRLDNFSAVEAAQMVKPIVDAQGQVVANARSNTLIVVDYASNMPRVRNIVAGLDKAGEANIQTLQLATVPAREMRDILNSLMGDRDNGDGKLEVTASSTSNAIVLSGPEQTVARAIQVATELDGADRVRDTLRVIELSNSDAVDIVPILERIAQSMSTSPVSTENGAGAATIAHHEPTNSLVISAPPDVLLAMERVVESLDQRRAQVLVEAIIVEMSDDTARELGVQFLLSGVGDSTVPFLSTNFSDTAPNLLTLAGAVADPDVFGGTNPFTDAAVNSLLGLEGVAFGGGGRSGDTLFGAILTAVETDRNSRVLSKPFNMTVDNGTSQLVVGQEIPITTGEVLGDANTNPFRTVQREQIGIKLEVTPRISADDTVRLDIYQEVSSIPASAILSGNDIIFNTREITTSVLADDGDIIVIGGLIEQVESEVKDQVPVLGDIPVVGNLFKTEGVTRNRTNLMVFIRPTIVRTAEDAQNVTGRNYRYLQAEAMLRTESDEEVSAIDGFVSETLGDLPKGALRGRSN